MNIYKQRLLNVVKALRESRRPDQFTMESFGGLCGTPYCALGHYAARADLQRSFKLSLLGNLRSRLGQRLVPDSELVRGHFGVLGYESIELFGQQGCGSAETVEQAIDYIEKFAARKWPESPAASAA